MPKISPFEKYAEQYEMWFEKNRWVYEAELRAVKAMMPNGGRGVEIGVGTGRFAEQLGIKNGVEPSKRMRDFAQKRGIRALDGVAEKLPFDDSEFDFVLMVTTVCFVDDISKALMEDHRVLSAGSFTFQKTQRVPGHTCCGREERCETPPCSDGGTCRRE
jgi:ubiquinone/menaquinone biosynthesis C-methylase UbiE